MAQEELTAALNRLAGVSKADGYLGPAGAANLWAGTTLLELVGALNARLGRKVDGSCLELNGALQALGIATRDPGEALALTENVLRLPGVSGNYASTPDSAALSITGDLDIRAKVAFDTWTPGTTDRAIVGKWTAAANHSYLLALTDLGRLRLYTSTDGTTTTVSQTSSVAVGTADGAALWVRVTLDIDNGASNGDTKFYTSTDGTTWTQLGTTQTRTGTTAIFDGTAALAIGAYPTTGFFPMRVYYADVRNSIGGDPVAVFDVSKVPVRGFTSPTTHTASTNEVWTINGSNWWWDTYTGTQRYTNAYRLPGTTGNYASTPDSAALSITGDIDIRVKVALSWLAAGTRCLLGKMASGSQRSYYLQLLSTGKPQLVWSADGTATITSASTAAVGFAGDEVGWVRVTLDVDNGAAGNDVKFYTSTDGVIWTQLGTTVTTALTTSIFDSTSPVEIGSRVAGTLELWPGRVYYAEIRNGIAGTVVGVFDTAAVRVTDTRLPATVPSRTGEVWTLNGTGWAWQVEG